MALDDLIEKSFSFWYDAHQHCDTCGQITEISRKTKISGTNGILIVKLDLFSFDKKNIKQKSSKWKLKAVPTTTVDICGDSYSVNSAVLHCNNESTDHYTALLRDRRTEWIHVDDANITKMRWPRNSKDVLLLFLERRKCK